MGRRKYRVGERVQFRFVGEVLEGEVKEVAPLGGYPSKAFSKYKEKYTIDDGKYKYPVPYEHITRRISE